MPSKILVAATTWDYVEILRQKAPGRLVFLTDIQQRRMAPGLSLAPDQELLCNTANHALALAAVRAHALRYNHVFSGIAAFDCPSLELAAFLAEALGLSFVSSRAVALCRDKVAQKLVLQKAGIQVPACIKTGEPAAALDFADERGWPVVLKPVSGTGGEGVYLCDTPEHLRDVFAYSISNDPTSPLAIEQFVVGPELSCDFLLFGGKARIVRITKKLELPGERFAGKRIYILGKADRLGIDHDVLLADLKTAAKALGIISGVCMCDFIWRGGRPCFLEITPRPGGDCLPWLIEAAGGPDMLALNLDCAEAKAIFPDDFEPPWPPMVGYRLMATRSGVITALDAQTLNNDPKVHSVFLLVSKGHNVIMPPDDYDSMVLGHVIFRSTDPDNISAECRELDRKLRVEVSPWEF